MKKIIVIGLFLISYLYAVTNYFMPTEIGSSARMIGQGNIEGFSPHAAIVFENPAGLSRLSQWSLSMFKTTYLDDYDYQNMAMAYMTKYGCFGLGYYGVSVSDIFSTSLNVADEIVVKESISYQSSVVKLSYSNMISPFLMYGVTVSHYFTDLKPRYGSGTNVDVGLLTIGNNVEWSFLVRNALVFNDVTYDNGEIENLPLQAIVSSRYDWGLFSALGQVKYVENQSGILKNAALYYNFPFRKLYVSGAYKEWFSTADQIDTSFTIGTGLVLNGVYLEYAYETSEYIDGSNKHYFSMGLHF